MEQEESLAIVKSGLHPSKYERILLSRLRDKSTSLGAFRDTVHLLTSLLVARVVDCLPSFSCIVETPVASCPGEKLGESLELVSILRAGDALLEGFFVHFPAAKTSKLLIQRDEKTAVPIFKYQKMSPSLASGVPVVIVEPMIATGGTLSLAISLLKKEGVKEENLIIASFFGAPEGIRHLFKQFPSIQLVMLARDEKLNERKYIVPGVGDFGDRYFGSEASCAIR